MRGIPWNSPVQYIKNVGPRRAALLGRLDIRSVGDLLYHFPRDYDDRSRLRPAHAYSNGESATIRGQVVAAEDYKPRKGLTIIKLAVHDGYGLFFAVWYNQPYIKRQLPVGVKLLVTGKVSRFNGIVQVQVVDYEVEDGSETLHTGRLVPVYPLTEQLGQRVLRSAVKAALDEWSGKIDEFIPDPMLAKYILPEIGAALHAVHFPGSPEEYRMARRRFVFEELLLHQLVLGLRRKKVVSGDKKHRYSQNKLWEERFLYNLPFTLTPGQKGAWQEITRDMEGRVPMYRLLQGDVGAGKTVVCALALLKAVDSGFQAALMAPTEILAGQHYQSINTYFAPLGLEAALLTGGMKKKEREALLERIKQGNIGVVLGTHALLQEDVEFNNLALVVIDEQHRFGVRQRALLQYKGSRPDVLVMTATPIPRTLALTVYGDLAVSTIAGLPPGRTPVKTLACRKYQTAGVYKYIREQVNQGRQAYIVCPLVEESEKIDVQSAVELAERLADEELSECRLGVLHGRMKREEKEAVITGFRKGDIDVLVSTTVVEVGVDVPNATVMLIIDAERFGLAQLHQLRGRVGRGTFPSRCYLVSDAVSDDALARLRAMTEITDGFLLAEKDLELRGPGELAGTRQSGSVNFKIADPVRDVRALQVARKEALTIIQKDPALSGTEHRGLLEELKKRFEQGLLFSSIG